MPQNIIIQEISEEKISLNINGQVQEIKSQLGELKELLKSQESKTVQYADKIYNIEHINEANFGLLSGKKAFNESITERLIEAIQPHNVFAEKLINYMQKNNIENWASQEKYNGRAKEILTSSYVGVIGMQLSHLMGIGQNENKSSEEKIIPYIKKCLYIAKYSLDLLNFTFISKLWDMHQKNPLKLTDQQRQTLLQFFERSFEPELLEQVTLLKTIYPLFDQENLPFEEMKGFQANFESGSSFYQSCEKLQSIKQTAIDKYSFVECSEAENELANVMVHLSFLANYNMASIKKVDYKFLRNEPENFIHNYFELGFDQKTNPDVEKHRYTSQKIATDTVLIYQGEDYAKSINLFPFVIDYNTLTFEQGPKIYFYQCLHYTDPSENTLEYVLLADDKPQYIEFKDTKNQNPNIDELVSNAEKLKTFNIDHSILQFKAAKASLTSQTKDRDEAFDALF